MSNNFYDTLGVKKTADAAEIKKAYRKKAMQYHPDKNKGDAGAEAKFKEVNEAYQTLSNDGKKKQYDMFGSTGGAAGNPFGGAGGGQAGGFGGFEDMFGGGGRQQQSSGGGFEFNMEDLFGGGQQQSRGNPFGGQQQQRTEAKKEPVSLDFEKTYEVPIFDLILGCSIEVSGVYGQKKKIKIPAGTKPGTKMRVKDFGKSEGSKKGNLLIKLEAKMPKSISEVDTSMLERIRDGVGY
ncbi:DnaJ domain-containing protein [Candidatus Gracilibacteria bacterium]|nr:DnaJ domain-containing protein [Candidatus Gracilibacteria bacterium]